MTTKLDKDTLEWAAQWIQDSLKGETNERVIEFGNNMAMTLRAAVQPAASTPTQTERDTVISLLRSEGLNPSESLIQDVINYRAQKFAAAPANDAPTCNPSCERWVNQGDRRQYDPTKPCTCGAHLSIFPAPDASTPTDDLEEDNELLRDENERLRRELGGLYAKMLRGELGDGPAAALTHGDKETL